MVEIPFKSQNLYESHAQNSHTQCISQDQPSGLRRKAQKFKRELNERIQPSSFGIHEQSEDEALMTNKDNLGRLPSYSTWLITES